MDLSTELVDSLVFSPWNARKKLGPSDPEYQQIRLSVTTHGYIQPIVVNRRNRHVISGNQRLQVLIELGYTQVQVVLVDFSDAQEKAATIALNKIQGRWDDQWLASLLQELANTPDFDLSTTGFSTGEASDFIAQILAPENELREERFDLAAEMAAQRPVVTQPGEILDLDSHRLMCGDSTDPEQVRRLMNGERAILFATDPPYLVDFDRSNHPTSRKKHRKRDPSLITWDRADANPGLYDKFIRAAIDEAILPNAAWYCAHASRRQIMVEQAWAKNGALVHQQILWVKDRPVMTRSWYRWGHEPIFFGWLKGKKPPKICDQMLSTVWQIASPPVPESAEHPTVKPLEFFEIPIKQHTHRGELCYEPFAGSGTQIIAAQRLGRRCFAMELSPRYCDLIVRRYIAFVGASNVPPALAERYRVTSTTETPESGQERPRGEAA